MPQNHRATLDVINRILDDLEHDRVENASRVARHARRLRVLIADIAGQPLPELDPANKEKWQ